MDLLLDGAIMIICLFFVTLVTNWMRLRVSLYIAMGTSLYFIIEFLDVVSSQGVMSTSFVLMLLCLIYILAGCKDVPFKTQVAVFSRLTGKPTGVILESGLGWIDPIFEFATVSTDGIPNIALDLQELMIEILETPDMQTKTRGIKAKVRDVLFFLKLQGDITELFEIEGGAETIRKSIMNKTLEFFLDEVGRIDPVDLDTDKSDILENLADKLKRKINKYCDDNEYPYKVVREITIGDTELEKAYYDHLAQKAYASLQADADDTTASRLKDRLLKLIKNFPGNNEKEKMEYVMNALKIVPRTTTENKISIDPIIAKALTDIAKIFKQK